MQNRLNKEIKELNIDNPIPGIIIIPHLNNRLLWIAIVTGPEGTPYQGGKFKLTITFPENYPFKAPCFEFQTKIFHPNIDEQGRFCPYHFEQKDQWQPTKTVKPVLEQILNLLREVNDYDDHNQKVMQMYKEDKNKFEEFARIQTRKHTT